MFSHRRRAASIGIAAAAALTSLLSSVPPATASPAVAIPTVSVSLSPDAHESLLGGACYRGRIEVDQPAGFVFSRSGSVAQPLDVTYAMRAFRTDIAQATPPETITIPAGSATAFVEKLPLSEPQVSHASWTATLEDGTGYTVGERSQSIQGLIGANPDTMGSECGIHDDTRSVRVLVNEEVFPSPYMWRVREFRTLDGTLPPGMRLDEEYGAAGTPTSVGTWSTTVQECPWPAVGDRICGRLTLTYEVVRTRGELTEDPDTDGGGDGDGDGVDGTDPDGDPDAEADTGDGSTTSTVQDSDEGERTAGEIELASDEDGGSRSGAARAAGGGAVLIGLTGLALVVRKVRASSG